MIPLVAGTMIPYFCSACLHVPSWTTQVAYDRALALDFVGIALGFCVYAVAWEPEPMYSVVVYVNLLIALGVFLGGAYALTHGRPVLGFHRKARVLSSLIQALSLEYVHFVRLKDTWVMIFLVLSSGFFIPWYFLFYVAYDCKRKALFSFKGVWEAHETWHVIVFLCNMVQLRQIYVEKFNYLLR